MQDNLDFLNNIQKGLEILQSIPSLNFHPSPRELVFTCDKIKLYHYASSSITNKTPLLIVFATVNRPDILDLNSNHSLIRDLLNQGHDIYLLDWGDINSEDSQVTMADYVLKYIDACINFMLTKNNLLTVNLLGICQGGILTLCYATIFDKINKLILISTPVDFHTKEHMIAKLLERLNANDIIQNIPGSWLTNFFISLRPFELIGKKYLTFVNSLENESFIDTFLLVEKWLHDAPDQPMLAFKQLLTDFYQGNKLVKNEAYLANRHITLSSIKIPILNIIGTADEIVPPSASTALKQYISPELYTEKTFPAGHIGIYISHKIGKRLSSTITEWLAGKY
ncbi:MAG: alpha/beta fold hydrolase [Gammaproteobacteria bacterium]